jgi:hypothetical protein
MSYQPIEDYGVIGDLHAHLGLISAAFNLDRALSRPR